MDMLKTFGVGLIAILVGCGILGVIACIGWVVSQFLLEIMVVALILVIIILIYCLGNEIRGY